MAWSKKTPGREKIQANSLIFNLEYQWSKEFLSGWQFDLGNSHPGNQVKTMGTSYQIKNQNIFVLDILNPSCELDNSQFYWLQSKNMTTPCNIVRTSVVRLFFSMSYECHDALAQNLCCLPVRDMPKQISSLQNYWTIIVISL